MILRRTVLCWSMAALAIVESAHAYADVVQQEQGVLADGFTLYLVLIAVAFLGVSGYFYYQRGQERKRTEDILRRSRGRLISVLDNMPAMIAYWKNDLHNEFGNKVYKEWFGVSPKEMRGKHIREVIGEKLYALNLPYIQAVLQGEPQFFERIITDQNGKVRITQAAYIPDLDGDKVLGFFALVTDISKLKETEHALRQSNALLSNLAAEVPGLIYQFKMFPDGHSCFPYASEGIRDIYEVTPEEARDDSAKVFARLHPDDFYPFIAAIQDSAKTLLPWRFEFRVQLPRQGIRWRAGNAQPERLADGSILWHGFIADITDRKNAELIHMQQQEVQRNALVREVHHRIKNNLQGVLGLLDLHIHQHPETAEVIQAVIGKIKSVVVVFGLQGRQNENNILLSEVVSELCNAAGILSPTSIRPVVEIDSLATIRLEADKAVPIALVINELITNAIKHSRDSGSGEPIHIQLRTEPQCAILTIRNRSNGLPADFDLQQGTGIGTGLTLVNFMLPRECCELSIAFQDGAVTTLLRLCAPVTTIQLT
jgi:PAS domain S-box-containing protein